MDIKQVKDFDVAESDKDMIEMSLVDVERMVQEPFALQIRPGEYVEFYTPTSQRKCKSYNDKIRYFIGINTKMYFYPSELEDIRLEGARSFFDGENVSEQESETKFINAPFHATNIQEFLFDNAQAFFSFCDFINNDEYKAKNTDVYDLEFNGITYDTWQDKINQRVNTAYFPDDKGGIGDDSFHLNSHYNSKEFRTLVVDTFVLFLEGEYDETECNLLYNLLTNKSITAVLKKLG